MPDTTVWIARTFTYTQLPRFYWTWTVSCTWTYAVTVTRFAYTHTHATHVHTRGWFWFDCCYVYCLCRLLVTLGSSIRLHTVVTVVYARITLAHSWFTHRVYALIVAHDLVRTRCGVHTLRTHTHTHTLRCHRLPVGYICYGYVYVWIARGWLRWLHVTRTFPRSFVTLDVLRLLLHVLHSCS